MGYPDMSRTREALSFYDGMQNALDSLLDAAQTAEDVADWEAADARTRQQLLDAFALDTADRNSASQAQAASVGFIRECVRGWIVQEAS